MKVKPLSDRILVKRVDFEQEKGGIIIPDTAKEKPKSGEVVALGTGKIDKKGNRQKFNVKKGDRILFESYAGTEITLDEEYLIMKEDEIIGVIEK